MSAQAKALAHWEHARHMENIERLLESARDYSFPAGQAQAGIQLATVEIPWLLFQIEDLKGQINDRDQAAA